MARGKHNQGWLGAVTVGGLIFFALFFLKPNSENARRARTANNSANEPGQRNREPSRDDSAPGGFRSDDRQADFGRTHTVGHVEASEARALLSKVAATYQSAKSYRDRTTMQMFRRDDPSRPLDRANLLVEFERPNRVRLDVSRERDQLLVVSDGNQMLARIIDPGTNNFDNQLVVKSAPTQMTLQSLYEACEYTKFDRPDERHSALLSLPAPLIVSQLSLLFDPGAMQQFVDGADTIEMLAAETFHGLPSERVRVTTNGGDFVFWIDPYSNELQRIDFPPPGSGERHDLSDHVRPPELMLTAEFRDRRFDEPLRRSSFQLPISQASQPVRHFVLPPEERSADLLGRVVKGYWFTDLYGGQRHDREWENGISVLIWFNNHPASRAVLQEAQQAASRGGQAQFLAICVEPTTSLSHRQVDQLVQSWSIQLPVVRDLEAFGRDVFRINQAPTIVVLDDQQRVQLVEVGGSAQLDGQLSSLIDRLSSGEDLARRYLDHLAAQRQSYESVLANVRVSRTTLDEPRFP